jgi:hypothetical protein
MIAERAIGLAGGTLVKREENRALIYTPTRLSNGTVVPAIGRRNSRAARTARDASAGR